MAHLDLAGVSADGRCLLLVGRQGEEFTLEITPALRAALRGETTRIGQLEIQMTSTLRPREIQTRIRAGETPEAVATSAQTTVEAIMPFVGPVLGEREHVAQRAQKSSLRRPAGDAASGTRVLRDAVSTHLSACRPGPTTSRGTRSVAMTAAGRSPARSRRASGRARRGSPTTCRATTSPPTTTTPAGWSVTSSPTCPRPPSTSTTSSRPGSGGWRRSPPTSCPLGDDALDLVGATSRGPDLRRPLRDTSEDVVAEPADATAEAAQVEAPHHRRPVSKKRGRASVPSWDEIMFGGSSE